MQEGLQRICDSPRSYPKYTRGARRALLDSFPYKIIYRIWKGSVQVLAIYHDSRDPGKWRER